LHAGTIILVARIVVYHQLHEHVDDIHSVVLLYHH
jgi:hypothetical protein